MSTTIAEPAVTRSPRPGPSPIIGALKLLASLKLTVVLFSLSLFLVLVGTLAQVDEGVWTVVDRYFRSMFVLVPFKLFFPRSMNVPGVFPFFGGWLLGAALLVNLLAAHLVRFRLTWKRAGILVIHSGIVVLLLSELIAGLYQVEARMTIGEGETVNYVELSRKIELAFTDTSNPDHDAVVAIPGSMLKAGATIQDDRLPVDIEINEFWPNSQMVDADKMPSARDKWKSITGDEWTIIQDKSGTGVETNQAEDAATARLTFKDKKSGQALETRTVSLYFHPNFVLRQKRLAFPPQKVTVDGKPYAFELRPVRDYKPYSLKLFEFKHDKYLGTETPKNFSSKVQVHEPDRGQDREVLISMNAPLRIYEGDPLLRKCETFYQSSFLPPELAGQRGTVLQVVRNPGWLMPYIACGLVTVGMLVHFGMNLVQFLVRRTTK